MGYICSMLWAFMTIATWQYLVLSGEPTRDDIIVKENHYRYLVSDIGSSMLEGWIVFLHIPSRMTDQMTRGIGEVSITKS